jgi:hypothetical protein
MSDPMRVFVNATPVSVPRGATALDAVRAWNAAEADAVLAGTRIITDSRGLPIDGQTALQAGAIFRLLPNRGAESGDAEPFD